MLVIKVKLDVIPGVREVLVLPGGVLQDGTNRRALTKLEPEAVLAYDEFTRAEIRSGDLKKLSEPYEPKPPPAPEPNKPQE
jgi:hypothetical protein